MLPFCNILGSSAVIGFSSFSICCCSRDANRQVRSAEQHLGHQQTRHDFSSSHPSSCFADVCVQYVHPLSISVDFRSEIYLYCISAWRVWSRTRILCLLSVARTQNEETVSALGERQMKISGRRWLWMGWEVVVSSETVRGRCCHHASDLNAKPLCPAWQRRG